MVIVSRLTEVGLDPFQMAELHGLYMGGDPNHLLNRMALQVGDTHTHSDFLVWKTICGKQFFGWW